MSELLSRDTLRETEAVLSRRIESLERENEKLEKRVKMGMVGLGVLFAVTVLIAFLSAPQAAGIVDSLHARQFVLHDENNMVRGILELDASGPRFILRDSDARERIRLSLLPDGSPGITLGDREGRPRVVLGLLPDGTSNLVFADAGGTARAVFGHSAADATTLVLADSEGLTRASLVVDSNGEGALLLDENGGSPQVTEETPPATAP